MWADMAGTALTQYQSKQGVYTLQDTFKPRLRALWSWNKNQAMNDTGVPVGAAHPPHHPSTPRTSHCTPPLSWLCITQQCTTNLHHPQTKQPANQPKCSLSARKFTEAHVQVPTPASADCLQVHRQKVGRQLNFLAHLKGRQAAVGAAPAAEGVAQAALQQETGAGPASRGPPSMPGEQLLLPAEQGHTAPARQAATPGTQGWGAAMSKACCRSRGTHAAAAAGGVLKHFLCERHLLRRAVCAATGAVLAGLAPRRTHLAVVGGGCRRRQRAAALGLAPGAASSTWPRLHRNDAGCRPPSLRDRTAGGKGPSRAAASRPGGATRTWRRRGALLVLLGQQLLVVNQLLIPIIIIHSQRPGLGGRRGLGGDRCGCRRRRGGLARPQGDGCLGARRPRGLVRCHAAARRGAAAGQPAQQQRLAQGLLAGARLRAGNGAAGDGVVDGSTVTGGEGSTSEARP